MSERTATPATPFLKTCVDPVSCTHVRVCTRTRICHARACLHTHTDLLTNPLVVGQVVRSNKIITMWTHATLIHYEPCERMNRQTDKQTSKQTNKRPKQTNNQPNKQTTNQTYKQNYTQTTNAHAVQIGCDANHHADKQTPHLFTLNDIFSRLIFFTLNDISIFLRL